LPDPISMQSISNARLTLLRKLNRKKYRERERLFVVEGSRAVEQVIRNGELELVELFFNDSQNLWQQAGWENVLNTHAASLIEPGSFAEISDTDTPQGVLALCKMPPQSKPEELIASKGVVVASDGIQDPGNLGTIIRTAVWFGAAGFLSGSGTVDLFHPKVVRSTAGATGVLKYRNGKLKKMLSGFEKGGWRVLLLDGSKGAEEIRKVPAADKTLIVVGNEAHGVSPELLGGDRKAVSISSKSGAPSVESLNAAIAVGIALYALS